MILWRRRKERQRRINSTEFLLAKDKIPAAESNKKLKSKGGGNGAGIMFSKAAPHS